MSLEQGKDQNNLSLKNRIYFAFGIAAQLPIAIQIANYMANGRPLETVENQLIELGLFGIQALGFNRYLKVTAELEKQTENNPEFQKRKKIEKAIAQAHEYFEPVNNPRRRDLRKKIFMSIKEIPKMLNVIKHRDIMEFTKRNDSGNLGEYDYLIAQDTAQIDRFIKTIGITNRSKKIKEGDIVYVMRGYGYYGNWSGKADPDRHGGGISLQIAKVLKITGDEMEVESVPVCDVDSKIGITNVADQVMVNIYTVPHFQQTVVKIRDIF